MSCISSCLRMLSVVLVGAAAVLVLPGVGAADTRAAGPLGERVAASSDPVQGGTFQAVDARRVLDTRSGRGASGPVPANGSRSFKVAGAGGIPATGIAAVALTLTVPAAAQSGSVTAFARGTARPAAPSLTFPAGRGVSTLVLAPVDATGFITLANNSAGPVQLIADTAGFTAAGGPAGPGGWVPLPPSRVVDTATALGATGPIAGRRAITPRLLGRAGIPSTGVAAVTMVVTVNRPAQAGSLTVRPEGQVPAGSIPTGANINFTADQSAGNLVVVPVTGAGGVQLFNNSFGAVGLTVDITGYLAATGPPTVGSLVPVPMTRLLDTRSGLGTLPQIGAGPLPSQSVNLVETLGRAGLPAGGASALLLSVTVAQPTRTGILRVHRDIADGSTTANINVIAAKNSTNLVLVPVSTSGVIHLTNPTAGTMHVIIDVVGFVQGAAPEAPMTWSRATPAIPGIDSPDLLDCTSSAFCLAMDDGGPAATYNGSSWSPVAAGGPGGFVTSLSCVTADFCMAVNITGSAAAFTGTSWGRPVVVAPGRVLVGVSCIGANSCLAVTDIGTSYHWNGASWAAVAQVTDVPDEYSPSPQTLSCASSTFCVAAGTNGGGWMFDGTSWSAQSPGWQDSMRASCPVDGFCAVLDSASDGWMLVDGGWNVSTLSWSSPMTGISCADATFCAAVGGSEVTVWDGTEWTNPALPIALSGSAAVISCPTRGFCMTLGYPGHQIIGTR
jgi:hypothetical protein